MNYIGGENKELNGRRSRFRPLRFCLLVVLAAAAGFAGAGFLSNQPQGTGNWRDRVLGLFRTPETPSPPARLGRMEQAPAYLYCANSMDFFRRQRTSPETNPRMIGMMIRGDRVAASYARMIGPFLICALDHNPSNVCDPDNRAMIVEGVSRYLVATDRVRVQSEAKPLWPAPAYIQQVLNQRGRMLNILREQIRAGRLIRSDFGPVPHPEIARIFDTTEAAEDRCAKR